MFKRFFLSALMIALLSLVGCERSVEGKIEPLPDFVEQHGRFLIVEQSSLQMEVLPDMAGRIAALKVGHHDLMVNVQLDEPKNWGTVLWSSPQSEWGWPPVDTLDNLPYTVSENTDELELTSGIDPKTGYQFTKRYRPAGEQAIAVTYRITNKGQQEKRVGALEVSRVPPAGEVFFPLGSTAPISGIFYPLNVTLENGLCWFHYQGKDIRDDHHKIMLDGKEGWVAYRNDGYLLIKQFTDMPPEVIAEGEREIEVFAHVDHTFIEIKQQSEAHVLAPGESFSWTVIWHALKLPLKLASDKATPAELADFVRSRLLKPDELIPR